MGKINIKGGTPVGSASLCQTCSWAHIMEGYRESELLAICTYIDPNVVVPFSVHKCTQYNDKNRPTREQMQKLAIDVLPLSSAKPCGFGALKGVREEEQDPALVGE